MSDSSGAGQGGGPQGTALQAAGNRGPANQSPANQDKAARGPKAKARQALPVWLTVLIFILLVPLVGVLFGSFVLAVVGMAPTILVFLVDKKGPHRGDRSFAVTVGLTNACGVLPSLGDHWAMGQTFSSALQVMVDPFFWILSFGSAGVGWLIFLSMPPLIAAYYNSAGDSRIRNLMVKQKGLVEIWGEEVKGDEEEEEEENEDEAQPGAL